MITMIDFLGFRAKAQLQAERQSHIAIEAARSMEVQRLGQLLNSTIMKLLALTDRDAARLVSNQEKGPVDQKPMPSPAFLRRATVASAAQVSKEMLDGAKLAE